MRKGIDVAKWQGTINWKSVKKTGVQFAILKIINASSNVEPAFERNYVGATTNDIPIGVYNYSYANTVARAESDARTVVKQLANRPVPEGVWLDVEDDKLKGLGSLLPKIINAYQKIIEDAGYKFGVYTGLWFYNNFLKPYSNQMRCVWWIARYPSINEMEFKEDPKPKYKPTIVPLWGWQYSSKGQIPGISGNVDLDIAYAEGNPYSEPTYTLYRGRLLQSKEYVMWLQYELNEMGYNLVLDGSFGKKTDAAFRDFQGKYPETYSTKTPDGRCGPKSRQTLKSL